MTINDPLGDMLTRIRNGQRARKSLVLSPASHARERVLAVLKREGYIRDYRRVAGDGPSDLLQIELKYHEGKPVIGHIQRASRPGRRVYSKADAMPRVGNGLGMAVVSTSRGVMSDTDARSAGIGGEVLCTVF